jgi:hypothetical protein
MATTVVIIRYITADISRVLWGLLSDITAATSTGSLTMATDTLTRPDTPTTAVIVITVAGIAVGVADNTA